MGAYPNDTGRGRNFPEVRVKLGVSAVYLAGGGAGIWTGIFLNVGSKRLLVRADLEQTSTLR